MINRARAEASTALSVEQLVFVRGLFGQANSAAAPQLAAVMRELYFPQGTLIYGEGEPADHLYFLVEGEVTMTAPGEDPWQMHARDLIGVLDAVLERPHARTAQAVADVRALVVSTEDWLELMEDNFELTRERLLQNVRSLLDMGLGLSPAGGFPDVARDEPPARRRDEVHYFERLLGLRRASLFHRARMQPLIRLAHESEARWLAAGTVLFRQGEPASRICLVAEGLVTVERDVPILEAAFASGAVVGGYAGLCLERRPFTATAAIDSVVVEIRYDRLDDVMEDHFDVMRSIMAFLALERERLQKLRAPSTSRAAPGWSIPPSAVVPTAR